MNNTIESKFSNINFKQTCKILRCEIKLTHKSHMHDLALYRTYDGPRPYSIARPYTRLQLT